jgi:hypothetical protein
VFNGRAHGYPAVFVHVAGITLVQTIERVSGPHARTYGLGKDEIIPPNDQPPDAARVHRPFRASARPRKSREFR